MDQLHQEVSLLRIDVSKLAAHVHLLSSTVVGLGGTISEVKKDLLDVRRFNNSTIAAKLLGQAQPWFNLKRERP